MAVSQPISGIGPCRQWDNFPPWTKEQESEGTMMNSLFTTISNTLDDDVVKSFKLYLDEFAILVVPV